VFEAIGKASSRLMHSFVSIRSMTKRERRSTAEILGGQQK